VTSLVPWAGTRHRLLGTDVHLLVTEPDLLQAADRLLVEGLAALDLAASRFREDSELVRLTGAGAPVPVSPLLAALVEAALQVAQATDGLVDPTLGAQLCAAGYDRTFTSLPADGPASTRVPRPGRWQDVHLDGDLLSVPADVALDLGASAKAWAADALAADLAALGTGVLVNLGGDLSVAGPVPDGGWPVEVRDRPDGPVAQTVAVDSGGLATSSTTARTWRRGGAAVHHVLDPRTGLTAPSDWASVTVAAPTCLQANAVTTAAVVLGAAAPGWVEAQGLAALLLGRDGTVVRLGGWP
jgi:thiamine biosynthesis lipoprotein